MSTYTRSRRSKSEMYQFHDSIMELCQKHRPLSIRQLYYLLVTSGQIEKTEQAYKQVIKAATDLRMSGEMPFGWIRDDSRRRMRMALHKSPQQAIAQLADRYAYDYQADQPVRLEVWCEKETLSGVLWPICAKYRVDLLPCKGMPSLTYRHEAALAANEDGRPFKVLYIGDSDPTGELIDPVIDDFMSRFVKVEWLGIERVAVTDEQRDSMDLPTRPAKESGARAGRHADIGCVEVEAIPPDTLREILENAIVAELDEDLLERAMAEDEAQQDTIATIARNLGASDSTSDNTVDRPKIDDVNINLFDGTRTIVDEDGEECYPGLERSNPMYASFWSGWGRHHDWLQYKTGDAITLKNGGKSKGTIVILPSDNDYILDLLILPQN